jgi:hypothetical protein
MISELDQVARIASLECGVAKIPCPLQMFESNLGTGSHEFYPPLVWRPARHILFSFSFRFSRGYARSKESSSAFGGRACADLGHRPNAGQFLAAKLLNN